MRCLECHTEVVSGFSECFTCGTPLPAVMRNANSPRHEAYRQASPQHEQAATKQRVDFSSAAAALSMMPTSSPGKKGTRRASPDRAAEADFYNIMYRKQRQQSAKLDAENATPKRQAAAPTTSDSASSDHHDAIMSERARLGGAVWAPDDELFPWRAERKKYLLNKQQQQQQHHPTSPAATGSGGGSTTAVSLAHTLSLQRISAHDALELHNFASRRKDVSPSRNINSNDSLLTASGPADGDGIYQLKKQQQSPLTYGNVAAATGGVPAAFSPAAISAAALRIAQQRQWLNQNMSSGSAATSSSPLHPTASAALPPTQQQQQQQQFSSHSFEGDSFAAQQHPPRPILPFVAHAAAFMLEMHTENLYNCVIQHRADLLRLLRMALQERVAYETAAQEIRAAETFAAKAGAIRTAESSKVVQENAELRFQLEEAFAAIERQKQITAQVANELAELRAQHETTRLAYQSLGSPVQGLIGRSATPIPANC